MVESEPFWAFILCTITWNSTFQHQEARPTCLRNQIDSWLILSSKHLQKDNFSPILFSNSHSFSSEMTTSQCRKLWAEENITQVHQNSCQTSSCHSALSKVETTSNHQWSSGEGERGTKLSRRVWSLQDFSLFCRVGTCEGELVCKAWSCKTLEMALIVMGVVRQHPPMRFAPDLRHSATCEMKCFSPVPVHVCTGHTNYCHFKRNSHSFDSLQFAIQAERILRTTWDETRSEMSVDPTCHS
jgi:hypothetical protein